LVRAGANDSVYPPSLGLAAVIRARRHDAAGSLKDLREAIEHCHRDGRIPTAAGIVELGIQILAELGQPESAAVLAGVVHEGCFRNVSISPVSAGVARDEVLKVLSAALDTNVYDRAFTEGARLTYDQAIDYVLGQITHFQAWDPNHSAPGLSFTAAHK